MWISNFLPYRMLTAIRISRCAVCNNCLTDSDIVATGVRKLDSGISVPYIEYLCKCGHRGIAVFTEDQSCDLYEFCYEIIMNVANRRQTEKSKFSEHRYIKSPMLPAEIDDFIKFVRASSDHEEFLKYIGSENIEETSK